jgi:hypothetical protein
MNEIGVVISRYHEDLRWVERIKAPLDIYIYNRQQIVGNPIMGIDASFGTPVPTYKDPTDIGNLNVETVKNNGVNLNIINMEDDAGFEVSTFLYHFWTKYDSLNEFTVCLQGRERGHIGTPFGDTDIQTLLNNPEQLKHTKFVPKYPGPGLLPAQRIIVEDCIEFEYLCDRFGWWDPYNEYNWSIYKNDWNKTPWLCLEVFQELAKVKWPPDSHNFGAGQQFMASKKSVLKHHPSYYKKMQEFVNGYMDPQPNRPGHPSVEQLNQGPNIIEAFWHSVF